MTRDKQAEAALKAFDTGIQYIYDTMQSDMPFSPDEIALIREVLKGAA